ncbi:MAG: DUF763 domain-containing protein [Proteobacteria bacterium]|nr:DUF763 domain-containing protein [Pseudomonadota bacterium]MBT6347991.1 DUF763 domain-containing protein [Pseudomonadota bacterium]
MISSGVIGMPLHFGRMPTWFTERMGSLSEAVIESVVQNYGKSEALTRLSDPNWFQALGAVAGMQYNSSGVTAAVLGSVRRKINARAHELGLYIAGGKGKNAWRAPNQLERHADKTGLDGTALIRSCNLARRVDNNAVQDGYSLYQQHFIVSDEGEWTGITQGMDTASRRARRYHMHSPTVRSFVDDPHTGIVGERGQPILNLADSRAQGARDHMVQLTQESPDKVIDAARGIEFGDHHEVQPGDVDLKRLGAVLAMAHGEEIDNFEDLMMLKGVGPATLKSLALVSEVIHGDASRFDDPARFSFAVGGKDGRPHPIDRAALDETINHLQESVEQSKLGYDEKSKALKRLHRATKQVEEAKSPEADIEALASAEWDRLERDGGHTFMGKVIPGVTKAVMGLQNSLLYGKRDDKSS